MIGRPYGSCAWCGDPIESKGQQFCSSGCHKAWDEFHASHGHGKVEART